MGFSDGLAKATIEEVTENVDELSQKVLEEYEQVQNVGLELNDMLIQDGVEPYMDLTIN